MSPAANAALDAQITRVFGSRADLARAYAEVLLSDGIVQGVIGPREAERIWPRHIFNSTTLTGLIPDRARVIDLGSGAGLPGIPLALARPDLSVDLLEPQARRVRFLSQVLAQLAVDNLTVTRARAEVAASGTSFAAADVVVARAVAPLPRLVELAAGLLRPDGRLLALKGTGAGDEAAQMGADPRWSATLHSIDAFGDQTSVVEVRRASKN